LDSTPIFSFVFLAHSRPANWDPEKIKKVELTQRAGTQNNGVNQLQVNIFNGNYYCSLSFGGQPWRSVLSNHELQGCAHLRINERSDLKVEVISNGYFQVGSVTIHSERNAVFRAAFSFGFFHQRTGLHQAEVFFIPPPVQFATQINCDGLNEPQVTTYTRENACASNRMRVKRINGQHNFFCDPGCNFVKNLNITAYNNGYRCFVSTTPQDNPQYCCLDGRKGGVPGCDEQDEYSREQPRNNGRRNQNIDVGMTNNQRISTDTNNREELRNIGRRNQINNDDLATNQRLSTNANIPVDQGEE
jgi:hypothetical protein